jgi:hypothetical protein
LLPDDAEPPVPSSLVSILRDQQPLLSLPPHPARLLSFSALIFLLLFIVEGVGKQSNGMQVLSLNI